MNDALYPEAMTVERFDLLCRWVRSLFCVLPLDEAVQRLRAGTLPARALSITFDDGYADNAQVALPILRRHGLTATFFVATGFLGGGAMWNDRVIDAIRRSPRLVLDMSDVLQSSDAVFSVGTAAMRRHAIEHTIANIKYLPPDDRDRFVRRIEERCGVKPTATPMMTPEQVVELRQAGMQIGAHTVSHPILALLDAVAARREMNDSKRFLESLLDEPVSLFAYPNGKPGEDYSGDTVALAKELGFEAAVSTARGAAHRGTDPFQIPRFTPWDRSRFRFGARLAANLWNSRVNRLGGVA